MHADPDQDQWAVGGMPDDIVSRVKTALTTRKAPVLVLYNHYGYWHAVYVVGFDDHADSDNCSFVEGSRKHFAGIVAGLERELSQAANATERAEIRRRLEKPRRTMDRLESAYEKGDGCRGTGVFYVRDSIYADDEGPKYDYDSSRTGDESAYGKQVILHEYEWLEYLGNHAVQIYVP